MTAFDSQAISAERIRALLHKELSTAARIGYTLLVLVGLIAPGLIASLWLTEPAPLPMATRVAFLLMVLINLSWAALATWVLTHRKVLFATHSVIAARMAVAFCALFLVAGSSIALQRGRLTALVLIGALGSAHVAVALHLLRRANRRRAALRARRDELTRLLSSGGDA